MKNPISQGLRTKTLFSEFEDLGEEKRRQKKLFPTRDFSIGYEWISKEEARTLWEFYKARAGAYEAFNFFHPWSDTYDGEYVGTGDGSTTVFNLPAENSSDYTVYVDGVEQTGGGDDYTFSAGGGTDGADKITFTSAPAAGKRITYDFTGNLKIRGRFMEDKLDWDTFYDRLTNMGLKIKGLLNA